MISAGHSTKTKRASTAWLLAVLLAGAGCADLAGLEQVPPDSADYWDSALVFVRHLDTALLDVDAAGFGLAPTGLVAAVAAAPGEIFFIDEGTGLLMRADLATMRAAVVARLNDTRTAGLHADVDGSLYVVDRYAREVVRYDPLMMETQRIPVGQYLGNPSDLVFVRADHTLAVLDALDGRIVLLDPFGGMLRLFPATTPDGEVVASAQAMAAGYAGLFVLDRRGGLIVGLRGDGVPVDVYGIEDLAEPRALAADACGRLFVADDEPGSLYIGFEDVLMPGKRVAVPQLAGEDVADLWSDGAFLYVATRGGGIYVLLVDPGCDS